MPLPPESVAAAGTFYSAQNPNSPPSPGDILGLPAWNLGGGFWLLDDLEVDYSSVTPFGTDAVGSGTSAFGQMRPDFEGGDNSDGFWQVNTNGLWLQITNVTTDLAYLNLNNATNQVYAIWSTINLSNAVWQVETEVWPTNSVVMPFIVPTLGRSNLFLMAEDWTGVTENGNATPDWWFFSYFGDTAFPNGHLSLYDTNLDSQGNTLLNDYRNDVDPNVIQFTLLVTNFYTSQNSIPVRLNVTGGVPFSVAVLVSNMNFSAASWQAYPGPNFSVWLGTNDGQYPIWIGLRGHLTNSPQTWAGITVTRDTVPPIITLTNPAIATVIKPIIQLQGGVSESLARFTYDITNAAGLLSNQTVSITGQHADTNSWTITTNYFQAYDVLLASGENKVTLHATDLAGNVTVTNYTFTLDYTTATNPPVITVTYPLTNSLVASSNFTLLGYLDNDTASLMVSNNNGSQTVSALVERGGNFSAANLALPNPTNSFTLIAADAVGNVSTEALTVLTSALTLTIDPVASSQLSGNNVTVTGTISDSNQNVWVNGAPATVTQNAWSASVTAPASGILTLVAQAGSDLSSPLGDAASNLSLPPVVNAISYVENYVSWEKNNGNLVHSASRDRSWHAGIGGQSTVHYFQYYPPVDCESSVAWPTNWPDGVTLSGTTTCQNSSASQLTVSAFQFCAAQQDSIVTEQIIGTTPGAEDTYTIETYDSRTATTGLELASRDPAQEGVQVLIRLIPTVAAYSSAIGLNMGPGYDDTTFDGPGDLPLTNGTVQIGDQTVDLSDTNSAAYVTVSSGGTQNLNWQVLAAMDRCKPT